MTDLMVTRSKENGGSNCAQKARDYALSVEGGVAARPAKTVSKQGFISIEARPFWWRRARFPTKGST